MTNLAKYYNQHKISPVRQDIKSIKSFFSKRALLYKRMGINENHFFNKNILEIGPGPGLNALYISSLLPKKYTLLDAGEESVNLIKKNFKNFNIKHTRPKIIKEFLENFKTDEKFDIVICEGVIVNNKDTIKNYKKLYDLIKNKGLLLTTFYPRIGLIANLLRKLIFFKLSSNFNDFNEKSKFAEKIFEPHLKTLKIKGRKYIDWVQDIIVNKYYLKQNFDLIILEKIFNKKNFLIHGTYPNFYENWDWYKDSKYHNTKNWNKIFIKKYEENYHNFLNFREISTKKLSKKEFSVLKIIIDQTFKYSLMYEDDIKRSQVCIEKIINNLSLLINNKSIDHNSKKSIKEAIILLKKKKITKGDFKTLSQFKSFFGREYCYICYEKR